MTSLEIVKERVSTANKRNLLLVNLSKEELEQIEKDLIRYEILMNKFDIYILDDEEGNLYYCMELNSNNCFIEITKEEYNLLSEIENRQMNIYDYRNGDSND